MKTLLLIAAILNGLAAVGIYFVASTLTGAARLNALSEMAELDHAGAIDPARMSEYNPSRYPTTAIASAAIRADLPDALSGGASGILSIGFAATAMAIANAGCSTIGYIYVRRRDRERASDHERD